MNLKEQQIKNDWIEKSRELLKGRPNKLAEIEKLWATEKYQEVYMFMDEFVRINNIKPSLEYQTADENA